MNEYMRKQHGVFFLRRKDPCYKSPRGETIDLPQVNGQTLSNISRRLWATGFELKSWEASWFKAQCSNHSATDAPTVISSLHGNSSSSSQRNSLCDATVVITKCTYSQAISTQIPTETYRHPNSKFYWHNPTTVTQMRRRTCHFRSVSARFVTWHVKSLGKDRSDVIVTFLSTHYVTEQ